MRRLKYRITEREEQNRNPRVPGHISDLQISAESGDGALGWGQAEERGLTSVEKAGGGEEEKKGGGGKGGGGGLSII